jgi:Tol biopolymer transport system component
MGGGSGQIAFASTKTGLPQIYLMDVTGSEPLQLTNMPEGACQPSWSPDGARLVFVSPCRGMEDIYFNSILYIINADGSGSTPIITVPGGDFEPDWSPDGTKIAFTSLRSGKLEIYVYNLEDQSVTQLTNRSADEASRQAAWSPDGTQIAFVVQRLGVRQIWLMSATGEDQRQIVRSGTRLTDYHPTWSVDGKMILFTQRRADTPALPYLMSIDAVNPPDEQGNRVQLNVLPVENVEFSPDGFWLVYEGDNRDILYVMAAGGSNTVINTGKGAAFDPTWRPVK